MKYHQHRYMEAAGEGGEQGGGSQGGTFNQEAPEVKAWLDQQVAGLKAKNAELIQKNGAAAEKLKAFDGIDPDAVRSLLAKAAGDEEAQMIAKGEFDKVLQKRGERAAKAHAEELKAVTEKLAKAEQLQQAMSRHALSGMVAAEFKAIGDVHDTAMQDAIMLAQSQFSVSMDESGKLVATSINGEFGSDQKPLTIGEFLKEAAKARPHWLKSSGGGSGSKASGGKAGQNTISRAEFDAKNPAERSQFIRSGGQVSD